MNDLAEDLMFSAPAAMRSSSWLTLGGRLYLTMERKLAFWPSGYDEPILVCPFEDVLDVTVDPAGLHDLLTGGIRNRLLRLAGGRTARFIVQVPRTTIPRLRSLILG